MRKVKNMQDLMNCINNNASYHIEINGHKYNHSIVKLLSTPLVDVINQINEGALYVSDEY